MNPINPALPMQELAPMPPMAIASPNRRLIGTKFAMLAVAGGLTLAACGGDNGNTDPHAQLGASTSTEGNADSSTSSSLAESTSTSSTSIAEGEATEVLDGSDDVIAADAHITRCGVDATKSEWSANAEAYILNQEANQDLLRSKEQVLFQKIGVNAANILADKAFTFDDVKEEFINSDSLYTRLIARFDAVQMTSEAVKAQPSRENYRCDDPDNSGVGDVSILRDIRSNVDKEGNPITLLALTLTPENWHLAVAAAYAEGIDLEAMLLTQSEQIEGLDKDGKQTLISVVRVFLEDDSCGNQVFESHPTPPTPPTTTPITPTTPPTTNYMPPKPRDTDPQAGGQGSDGSGQDATPSEDDPVDGYDPASEEIADEDGDRIHIAIDACPKQPETYNGYQDEDGCPDVAPATATTAVPAGTQTGTAPASTNPPVVASTVVSAPPVVTVEQGATTTTFGVDND